MKRKGSGFFLSFKEQPKDRMEVRSGHGWMSQHRGNHWLPRNPIPSFRMSIFLDVGYPAMASPSAKIPSVGHRKGKTMTVVKASAQDMPPGSSEVFEFH